MKLKGSKFKKLNIGLASLGHAIPVIGHDKVVFRVEKILENMNGLAELNVHDLRTILQRDNDGDHLYLHTLMPREVFKGFARENGRKDDFRMFNTDEVLNLNSINIFGLTSKTVDERKVSVAGDAALSNKIGFQDYASKLYGAKKIIGQVIGMRSALSWISNLDIKFEGTSLFKNFGKFGDMNDPSWAVLNKIYDSFQNSVDIHNGVHHVFQRGDALKQFLLFGRLEKGFKDKLDQDVRNGEGDPNFVVHTDRKNHIFGEQNADFGKKLIEQEIVYEMIKLLRKPSKIIGETWDESGSRKPEPNELSNDYYNLRRFFSNPSMYLADKMRRRISYYRTFGDNKDLANKLLKEYVQMFYGKDYAEYRNLSQRAELYKSIIKGKTDSFITHDFSFNEKQIPPGNPEIGFDFSITGSMLRQLISTPGFWEANYTGVKAKGKTQRSDIYDAAGYFIRNMENYVETARMFGDDINALQDIGDISISSFGNPHARKEGVREALNRGVLRDIAHTQHNKIMESLQYMAHELSKNPNKVKKIQQRLSNLQSVMEILDIQIAKNMVVKSKHQEPFNPKFGKNQIYRKDKVRLKSSYQKSKSQVAIYSVSGDVRVDPLKGDKAISMYDYRIDEIDGPRIDYSQLHFEGYYRHGDNITWLKNKTYMIDYRPHRRTLSSSVDEIYSKALFDATYGTHKQPENFLDHDLVDSFRRRVMSLRNQITMDYRKTIEKGLSQRVLMNDIFEMGSAREFENIKLFLREWEGHVKGTTNAQDLLLNYIIQPQFIPTKSTIGKDGKDQPVFRTDMHLLKTILDYAETHGRTDYVQELMTNWENYASGKASKLDHGNLDRFKTEKYDFGQFGDMAGSFKFLAKWNGIFYADPYLQKILDDNMTTSTEQIHEVKTPDGPEKIHYNSHKDYNNQYFQIIRQKIAQGEGSTDC